MRPEKATIISDLKERLESSPFVIITDYGGLQVKHFEELRKRLGEVASKIYVVKNTFMRRAASELGMPDLSESLTGQTAIVTGESDVCAAAKVLKGFIAEFQKPTVRRGVLDNEVLTVEQINDLAELPSKEVLRAQLLGLLQSPATKLVRTLSEPGASLARLLKAKAEKEGA